MTFAPQELEQHLDALAAGEGVATLPIEQTIFGRSVPIGLAEIALPPMKVVETRPSLERPGAVSVRVEAATKEASRPFKLLPNEPPLPRVFVPKATIHVARSVPQIVVPKPGESIATLGQRSDLQSP